MNDEKGNVLGSKEKWINFEGENKINGRKQFEEKQGKKTLKETERNIEVNWFNLLSFECQNCRKKWWK